MCGHAGVDKQCYNYYFDGQHVLFLLVLFVRLWRAACAGEAARSTRGLGGVGDCGGDGDSGGAGGHGVSHVSGCCFIGKQLKVLIKGIYNIEAREDCGIKVRRRN